MPISRRALGADEELGKKDDDYRLGVNRVSANSLPSTSTWRFPRRRRILLIIAGVYLLYLFFKNMPSDLQPAMERYDPRFAENRANRWSSQSSSLDNDRSTGDGTPERYDYEGPLKFPALARSLYRTKLEPGAPNNGVIFAAADLRSVSDLIPLACDMARQKINTVHFALMGRDRVSIEGIQHVNGISAEDCPMTWHDARPDFSSSSTEERMEYAVMAGVDYMNSLLKPQVVISHTEDLDEGFFWDGITRTTTARRLALVGLSTRASDVMWMSDLDSSSLAAWDRFQMEILVQAPSDSSGSMIRLLRSLERADYLGSRPALTIELPQSPDPFLLDFIKDMKWPSPSSERIALRRRVESHRMTPMEAAIRTAEAFYAKDPDRSHLLLLSPQAELSPAFYHYLKYTVLKYRYSTTAVNESSQLLGVSLDLPALKPTDDSPFIDPTPSEIPVFRWQVPNSNAALYFGDKWAEFHSFLTRSRATTLKSKVDEGTKLISKKYPAFMEPFLELIRTKGYYLLYPAFPATQAFSLVTIHNDLYRPPEEFVLDPVKSTSQAIDDQLENIQDRLTEDTVLELGSLERPLSSPPTLTPLLQRVPRQLPRLESLPFVSFEGDKVTSEEAEFQSREFARQFSTSNGGCQEVPLKLAEDAGSYTVEDLFCLEDV